MPHTKTILNRGAQAIWERKDGPVCSKVLVRILRSKGQPLAQVEMKTLSEMVTSYS